MDAHRAKPAREHNHQVTRRSGLDAINELVHDEFFELDRLSHNLARREVRLPVFRGKWTKALVGWRSHGPSDPPGAPFGTLVVRSVVAVRVHDEAEIGWYDIGRLTFDPASRELRITSNVPCEIVVECDELNVEFIDE